MKIRTPWTPPHEDQASRQGYPQPNTLSALLDKTSRVWRARETATPSSLSPALSPTPLTPIGPDHHHHLAARGAQAPGAPSDGPQASDVRSRPRTVTPIAPRALSDHPTAAIGITATNQTWIDPQSTTTAADASASSSASGPSRLGPMSLNGDEVVALISGGVILILFLSVLCIWLCFRDPNRNAPSIDAESRRGLSDTPPVISLTLLEPSALPKSHHDVLGRAAETGPGAANWPLPQNQVRIPLRPRPNRRTLSSELSPFGYIRRSNLSDLASSVGNGGGESAPNTRPASISAAWLSPSRAMFGRGAAQGSNSPAPSTAPAGPSSSAPPQRPLSPV